MDFKDIYELTVRCTAKECEEDLAVHKVIDIDDEYVVYFAEKKVSKDKLMEPVAIKMEDEEFIYRVTFLAKKLQSFGLEKPLLRFTNMEQRRCMKLLKKSGAESCILTTIASGLLVARRWRNGKGR